MFVNDKTDNMISYANSPKRPRTHFMWRRALRCSEEYEPLKLREKPNLNVLRMMLDMNRDDDAVRANIGPLTQYENEMLDAGDARNVFYDQKSIAEFATTGYHGAKKFGRAYCGSKLNWMNRRLVNTMYRNSHQEIDLRCSYQTMIYNAFDHVDLPTIRLLLRNPSEIIGAIAHETHLGRDEVKTALIASMCSLPRVDYGFGDAYVAADKVRTLSEHPFMKEYINDMKRAAEELKLVYPEFYATMKSKASKDNKIEHVDGIALSHIAMDMEHAVMRYAIDQFPMEEPNMIWYFDGLVLPNKYVINADSVCTSLETKIRERFDIRCEFQVKDVAANSIAWSLSPMELSDSNLGYPRFKMRFEKDMCRFLNPAKFGHFFDDGKLQFLSKEGFSHVTMEQNPEYIKQWLADPDKRMYNTIEFSPPPLVAKPKNFNPWKGFAAESLPPIENPSDIERLVKPYKDHVFLLVGEDKAYEEYMHKMIAFKIQKPGLRWNVMPYFFSAQGVGKDQWFKILSNVVGSNLCYTATNFGELKGSATSLIDNKIFVCFSEMSAEDSIKHTEWAKMKITSESFTVNAKYVPEYENRSCHSFIGFTNYMNAINFKSDDRRFVAFQSSGKYRNDPEYHGPFNDYINDKVSQRAIYEWLLAMDIEDFNPMKDRPMTKMHAEVADYQKPMFDIFLENNWESMKMSAQFTTDFKQTRIIDNTILQINSSLIQEYYATFLKDEMKLADMQGAPGSKIAKTFVKHSMEASSKIDKYKTLEGNPIQAKRYKDRNMYQFHIDAIEMYIKKDLKHEEDDDEIEQEGQDPDGYEDRSHLACGFTPNSR